MPLRLVDNHVHLQDSKFGDDIEQIIQRARRFGIAWFACNGTREQDWPKVLDLCKRYPSIIPCFGLHPWYASQRQENWIKSLTHFLQIPGSCLGEIGLDRWIEPRDEAAQEEVFRSQLRLAKDLHRPASLHCLRAWGWLMEVLRQEKPFTAGLLIHAYGGSAELIGPLADLGAYFSFAGNVLEERKVKQREALQQVPLDRLLLESDAPDLTPPPAFRVAASDQQNQSERNEPANLSRILEGIANLLKREAPDLADILWKNSTTFWNLTSRSLAPPLSH